MIVFITAVLDKFGLFDFRKCMLHQIDGGKNQVFHIH